MNQPIDENTPPEQPPEQQLELLKTNIRKLYNCLLADIEKASWSAFQAEKVEDWRLMDRQRSREQAFKEVADKLTAIDEELQQ